MTLRNKLHKYSYIDGVYLVASALLGLAIVNDTLLLGVFGLGLQFLWFRGFFREKLKISKVLVIFFGSVIFMMSVMSWYSHIEPHGWDSIAGLPPNVILLLAVFVVSLFCSALAALLWAAIYLLLPKPQQLNKNSLQIALVWATGFMLFELVISSAFSLATTHAQAPIAPTWNLFSIAILTATNPLITIGSSLGFWGTTWLMSFCVAAIIQLVGKQRSVQLKYSLFLLAAITAIALVPKALKQPASESHTLEVAAVSQRNSQPDYLDSLRNDLKPPNKDESPLFVVLPEYSGLYHPSDGGPLALGYDARFSYPEAFKDKPVYFVGTETEQHDSQVYVESYVANGELQKVKRQVKTFLIPGGEYVVPWVRSVLSAVDAPSVASFANTRSRTVIDAQPEPEVETMETSSVGIGACSTLLLPYHFQNEVRQGAQVLTSNVSYEQFINAPEYERFATRFARFHARSLDRWFVVGARSGSALIIAPDGSVVTSASSGDIAYQTITTSNSLTVPARFGEKAIVTLIGLATLTALLVCRYRHKQPLRIEALINKLLQKTKS